MNRNGGVALLVGAGDAIGAAVARRFARGGYRVCMARRDAGKSRRVLEELTVCLFNAGSNVNKPLLETTEKQFFKVWELACYAGFLVGREAARHMLKRGRGTILFTGATASVRGGRGFAAFAAAKFGLRAVAQSMARELGPKNIHVV